MKTNEITYKRYEKAKKILEKFDEMLEEMRTIDAELIKDEKEIDMLGKIYGEILHEQTKLNEKMFKWVNDNSDDDGIYGTRWIKVEE